MVGARAVPEHRDIAEEVGRRIEGMSPQIRRVARFCLNHGDEVAFLTVRELADHAGVSPASVMRLARDLGFSGYLDFRAAFRSRVRSAGRPAAAEAGGADEDIAAVADRLLTEKLDRLFQGEFPGAARRIAARLVAIDKVYVAGFRSAHAFAHYFAYLGQMAFPHFALVGQNETALYDVLARARGRAAAVIFSFSPYSIEAVRFAELAVEAGLDVIAVTDTAESPLARLAADFIAVPTGRLRHLPTLTAGMAACEVLLEYCIEAAGEGAAAEIAGFEQKVRRMQGYW
ncbi:MAG TPA: MurR/RpiR family transcriptional regulator [Kaistiaceae bacterium]|nr:MurR/RpiR family transcriptional regulator [Kaistiaceae bacterium]